MAGEFELTGSVAAESRLFLEHAQYPGQHGANGSLEVKPEFYYEWNGGTDSLVFTPFMRLDQGDSARSHLDLSELSWVRAAATWELRAGVRRVFWGVAESNHLIDILNQTDLVENPDAEDKTWSTDAQPGRNSALGNR
ncbi:MAG: hypothetical protein EXR86_15155 [Gammaproteobacteria bacterium]|nr:hypothetical protein [Gammaproteobacteria bacterium]